MAKKKNKKSAVSKESKIVSIISDIHFDLHDVPTWRAFRKWHAEVRPYKTIVLGDFVDLGMMSRWEGHRNEPQHAIPQLECCVGEMNELVKECGELIMLEGNHDERWDKLVLNAGASIKDALGLTLREQMFMLGLDKRISYFKEDTKVKGVKVGPYLLRHGHRQGSRFGGGKHLAATRLQNNLHENEIFGHFHKAQMFSVTGNGRTATAIANPCMTGDHEYQPDPNWQRGFTIMELYGPDNMFCNARPIVMNGGHFAYSGKVYDGNI